MTFSKGQFYNLTGLNVSIDFYVWIYCAHISIRVEQLIWYLRQSTVIYKSQRILLYLTYKRQGVHWWTSSSWYLSTCRNVSIESNGFKAHQVLESWMNWGFNLAYVILESFFLSTSFSVFTIWLGISNGFFLLAIYVPLVFVH